MAHLFAITFSALAHAEEKRAILSLVSGEPALPWTDDLTRAFVDVIDASPNAPTLYFEYVDAVRFEEPRYTESLREWLRSKYRSHPIDLVVIRGQEAAEFHSRAEGDPWRETPVLYTDLSGLPPEIVEALPHAQGLILEDHTPEALATIQTLLPETERIALVYGASSAERVRYSGFPPRVIEAGLTPLDLGGRTMVELRKEVSRLPERTAILFFPIQVDAEGRTFPTDASCGLVSAAANRPLFSLYRMHLGCGAVGGRMLDFRVWGGELGKRALEALDPRAARKTVTVPVEMHSKLAFDARALARWDIDESVLPQGSEVLFREPSLWRDYRGLVLAALAVGLVQALLIAGLVLERRRRHRAELAGRRHLATMSHLDRRAALGELAASLAHELGQPLSAILANAKAADLILARGEADLDEIRNILEDIQNEDRRAAEIIRGMRALLRNRELTRSPLDLNQLVRESAAIVNPEATSRAIDLELVLAPGLAAASGEPIYLQQVLLNLLLNGIAAVSSQAPGRRRIRVRTGGKDGLLEVRVEDTGHGIPEGQLATIFEPFVTTKETGLGVGLSISRSIVEAHGGRIDAVNNAEGGATFRFTIPRAS